MIKVGDKVDFKNDVEGTGYVVEIIKRRYYNDYLIANRRRDCSPWHIMATFSHKHMCNVVLCDEDHVWEG